VLVYSSPSFPRTSYWRATTPNKFRQVDHRTIEWIVFKNVKYVLKKGAKKGGDDQEEEKK
jgi:hypothetical protein